MVVTLGVYQLCTSGIFGVHQVMSPKIRGTMLGGLLLLLLPLLFLWVPQGTLLRLVKGCAAADKDRRRSTGEDQSVAGHCQLLYIQGDAHTCLLHMT